MSKPHGAVATGQPDSAAAAAEVLRAGGNAVDAGIAAMACACVAEPVLASLAGGAFSLLVPPDGPPRVVDSFVSTPARARPLDDIEFVSLDADFGDDQQPFHVGRGTCAVPGIIDGLFALHRIGGTMPMRDLLGFASRLAASGVTMRDFDAQVLSVCRAIVQFSPELTALYASADQDGSDVTLTMAAGERVVQPALADFIDALGAEGPDLFYRGEAGTILLDFLGGGGQLQRSDLERYRSEERSPLTIDIGDHRLFTNPPPAAGGAVVSLALELLEALGARHVRRGTDASMAQLSRAFAEVEHARAACGNNIAQLGSAQLRTLVRDRLAAPGQAIRGTTHISIVDGSGQLFCTTLSNGTGAGCLVPGLGLVPNNMLGESDLVSAGPEPWTPGERLVSMMAPTALLRRRNDGTREAIAIGSGGSSRIRSAITQVTSNLMHHGMTLHDAVRAPRLHYEAGELAFEPGWSPGPLVKSLGEVRQMKPWEAPSLFFGGVHSVLTDGRNFEAVADTRRAGASVTLGDSVV